jgi:enediyne biosynthesis protein E4
MPKAQFRWMCSFLFLALGIGWSGARSQAGPESATIEDVSARAGIRFQHDSSPEAKYIVESMSGGVALIDYDNDGYSDIYFTNAPSVATALAGGRSRSALYHNNHDGTFTDVTDKAGVGFPCWAMGAAVGDYDDDGWPDLAVSCLNGVVLYRNNHDGTFTDVTKKAGLDKDKGWSMGLSFGDADGDGRPDLFVPHYVAFDLEHMPEFGSQLTCKYHDIPVQCGPRGLKGSPDALYHNNGDGTFSDVSKAAGVQDDNGYFGLQSVWSDFDGDGKLDLFLGNDGEPSYLYHNEGGGHFKEIASEAGVAYSEEGTEQANMGIALGDFDHSGRQSMVISHFSEDYAVLYKNLGKMNFADISHEAKIAQATRPYVGWGDAFLDTANRGELDLMIANGHVYPQVDNGNLGISFREPSLLFWNNGNGSFREVGAQTGTALQTRRVSRGLVVSDLFRTGNLDVVVENLTGEPTILAIVPPKKNHWVSFQLEGDAGNRLALNATVRVRTGKVEQSAEVRSGGSYLSQNDLKLHYGLGESASIDQVTVQWPNGRRQEFTGLAADRFYRIKEGGAPVAEGK